MEQFTLILKLTAQKIIPDEREIIMSCVHKTETAQHIKKRKIFVYENC